jgi:DNA-binding FadR family transcriptional regulator
MSTSSAFLFDADPTEALRRDLLDGIRQGRWTAGTRLPTERSLCEHYGVSRSALRRVLQDFKNMGVVVQRVGSGTYVTPEAGTRLSSTSFEPSAISPAEIMEARLLLEPLLMDLVVNNATAADFEKLDDCCAHGEAARTLEEVEHWDSRFHEQLAHATHNAFFICVFELVAQVRDSGEWGLLKKKSVTAERRRRYEREHRELVAALKNRDVDTARHAISEHLLNIRYNLLGRL